MGKFIPHERVNSWLRGDVDNVAASKHDSIDDCKFFSDATIPCSAGMGWDFEKEYCVECPPGTWSDDAVNADERVPCQLCGHGKYSNKIGATSETTCFECGTSNALGWGVWEGQTECLEMRCFELVLKAGGSGWGEDGKLYFNSTTDDRYDFRGYHSYYTFVAQPVQGRGSERVYENVCFHIGDCFRGSIEGSSFHTYSAR